MINKLTGEPVSAEMQNVLKRLANSENVPEAEIQQLKETRIGICQPPPRRFTVQAECPQRRFLKIC